jgi:predicted MFS family arabinose efflux permease
VIDGAPPEERSQAVATFSVFFDLSQGLGAPLLGTVVAIGGERWAFVTAGLLSAAAFAIHRASPPPRRHDDDADTAALACPA